MMVSQPSRRATLRTAAVLGLLPLVMAGLWLAGPDRLLERSFAGALANAEAQWTRPYGPAPSSVQPASLVPAPVRASFAIGDRLLIDSRTGQPETIDIVAIEQVDGTSLGIEGVAFQMVTGRSATRPHAPPVRFLFAVEAPAAPNPASAL